MVIGMQNGCAEGNKERVYELAIFFARMWGVAETLEEIPNMEFKAVRDRVVDWAAECIASQEEDFIIFFQKKMKEAVQDQRF